MPVKQKDIKVGTVVRLGKFIVSENKTISEKIGTVTAKSSGSSGTSFTVYVEGVVHPWSKDNTFCVHLRNIKEIIS